MPPVNGPAKASAADLADVLQLIKEHPVVLAGNPNDANFCKMKQMLDGVSQSVRFVDTTKNMKQSAALLEWSGRAEYPLVWVKACLVGGLSALTRLEGSGRLLAWLEPHDYDLIVIGGGSGGLAASKAAAALGAKVAVLDFVTPSPKGSTWGLGGTCVNVGCIPKKLMHQAAILGKSMKDASKFGWGMPESAPHSWEAMKEAVQRHIANLNWGYKVQLREASITYLNALGSFTASHTVKAVDKRGKEKVLSADRFILATGLRPRYPDIPGAREFGITSDDLFSLDYAPGKTLLVGASYISLECGGFLAGMGFDVTVMVRSILLRGFDQDMANRVGKHMEENGVKFIRGAVPSKIEQIEEGKPGRYRVTATTSAGETITDEYNTVVIAIGREAITDRLGLDHPGVETDPKSKKMLVSHEQSVSCPWVFGVGDVAEGIPELTPVAIQAGRLLSRRLFNASPLHMDYSNIPTTVFTPLEYACCGLAEEDAIAKYGTSNIVVYHSMNPPLEYQIPERDIQHCYAKMICNKADDLRVLGLHFTGPNAGEVMQGFALSFVLKARKADLDAIVGIHPTAAEVFTQMSKVKKEDGEVLEASGCGGGG